MSTAEMTAKPAKTPKVEEVIFEIADQRPSGFIQEGTEKLPEPIELKAAKFRSTLRQSHYINDKGDVVYIRYINGVDEIIVDKQNNSGLSSRVNPKRDMIVFKDGNLVVANEGKLKGLVSYMRMASYCGTNPNRDKNEPVLWNEVFPEKTKSGFNDRAFFESDAISIVKGLVEPVVGGYEYDEEKLSAYCDLFGATAESPAGKVSVLIAKAKMDPKSFIETVQLFEKTYITEISIGVEVGLIEFGDTDVSYVGSGDIITTYNSRLTKAQKYERLASHFQTFEGNGAYQKFKVELEQAKNRKLSGG